MLQVRKSHVLVHFGKFRAAKEIKELIPEMH